MMLVAVENARTNLLKLNQHSFEPIGATVAYSGEAPAVKDWFAKRPRHNFMVPKAYLGEPMFKSKTGLRPTLRVSK